MSEEVIVTGGSGFIGYNLVLLLLKLNYKVKVYDNNLRGSFDKFKQIKDDIEFIEGDIRDLDVLIKASKGVEKFFHLAALNGTSNFYERPDQVIEIGTKGIINAIDAAKKNNISEFYLASTSEVYNIPPEIPTNENVRLIIPDVFNPRYSYAGSKIISELYLLHFGSKYFERSIIFRPHNVYGPNMGYEHVIPELIKKIYDLDKKINDSDKLLIQGSGNETRAFIFINDFIDAMELIIRKGLNLNIYNIGNSKEIKIIELAKSLIDISNNNYDLAISELKQGSTSRRCPNIDKISKLGYAQKVSLLEGLKLTYKWYYDNYQST